jgi:hypothetical protein
VLCLTSTTYAVAVARKTITALSYASLDFDRDVLGLFGGGSSVVGVPSRLLPTATVVLVVVAATLSAVSLNSPSSGCSG